MPPRSSPYRVTHWGRYVYHLSLCTNSCGCNVGPLTFELKSPTHLVWMWSWREFPPVHGATWPYWCSIVGREYLQLSPPVIKSVGVKIQGNVDHVHYPYQYLILLLLIEIPHLQGHNIYCNIAGAVYLLPQPKDRVYGLEEGVEHFPVHIWGTLHQCHRVIEKNF